MKGYWQHREKTHSCTKKMPSSVQAFLPTAIEFKWTKERGKHIEQQPSEKY